MAMDIKPEGELFSHQFSMSVRKGEEFNHEEFERGLNEFMKGFLECYPHYIIKQEFKGDIEHWTFKFWIEKT